MLGVTTDDDGRGRAARAIHLDLENSSLNGPAALNVLNVSVQHLSCVEIPTELGPDESLSPSPAPFLCWASQGSCLGGQRGQTLEYFRGIEPGNSARWSEDTLPSGS